MSKSVFIHCQTFSRKPNRIGQCVAQIVGEGLRNGGFHSHVENPQPPRVIHGDPSGFEALHEAHVAARMTLVSHRGIQIEKKIRADRHTLFSIIASYPVPVQDIADDPEKAANLTAWEGKTLDWIRGLYGDQLQAAFAHDDEAHPHLHFWVLPDDPSGDATRLHPGKTAKRETEARLKAEGVPPREAVRAGNRALKAAMRAWIDDYHRPVGAPLGLTRDGPKRRRLSRAQYRAEAAMMEHHHNLAEDRARLEAEIAVLAAQRAASEERIRSLDATAAHYVEAAGRLQERLKHHAKELDAAGPLLDAIVSEIDRKTMACRDGVWHVQDPRPFQQAPLVWKKLSPVILQLLKILADAEEGRIQAHRRARGADRRLALYNHLLEAAAIDLDSPLEPATSRARHEETRPVF
jgi:hypothetical protein